MFNKVVPQSAPAAVPTKPAEPEVRSFEWFVKQANNISRLEYYLSRAKLDTPTAVEKQQKDYDVALDQALDFGGKEDYLEWVKAWKAANKLLVEDASRRYQKDANGEWLVPKYYKETRRSMYLIRVEGKRHSWAKKLLAKNAN